MNKKILSFIIAILIIALQIGPSFISYADNTVEHQLYITLNNGEADINEMHLPGESIQLPENPIREGFRFAYWEIMIQPSSYYRSDLDNFTLDTMPEYHTFVTARWLATDAEESEIKTGDLISFGSYPQSEVTDEAIINVLNTSINEDDWISYGYYTETGTFPTEYMRYADTTLDGVNYRAVIFDEGGAAYPYGFQTSTIYWYKFEPITWRIADAENKIIVTDNVVDAKPFNKYTYQNTDIEDSKLQYFSDSGFNNYANAWSASSLRTWLNSEFYNTAFSESQQDNILLSSLPENTDYYTLQGTSSYEELTDIATDDYVYLLSNDEVNDKYLSAFDNGQHYYHDRTAPGTEYARSQGAYVWNTNRCWWYLRTPGHRSLYACFVDDGGTATINGTSNVTKQTYGIRPAVKVSDLTFVSEDSPTGRTISYYSDGVKIGSERYYPDEVINPQVEAPEKEGYTFDSWENLPEFMPNSNISVNAKWTVNQYTITFNTGGGTPIEAITQDFGTQITLPDAPAKEGFTFSGWDTEIPKTMPAENLTFSATWSINQYTISFTTDGGTEIADITLNYGEEVTVPENPVKEGYTFAGWDREIPHTMPAENITVNALYNITYYYIVLYDSDGSVIDRIPYTYGETIMQPPAASKSNHEFIAWIGELPDKMPAVNLSLTASWRMRIKSSTDDVTIYCPDKTPFINSDYDISNGNLTLVTEELNSPYEKIPSGFNAKEIGGDYYALYKITLKDESGDTVQPYGTYVTVKLPIPKGMDTSRNVFIMHFKADGTTERITMADERVWFEDGYICFTTSSFSEFGLCAQMNSEILIKAINKYNGKVLDYRTTLTLHAQAPYNSDSSIIWFVNGKNAGSGETLTIKEMTESNYTIQAKIIENGNEIAVSDTEAIKINNNFFARIIAFVRNLFKKLPILEQI